MSVNKVNSDGSLSRVAGGTLYADLPIGTISPFGGSVIPNGYLLCDGRAVSRTEYSELFAVIGIAFGSGDDNTSFNLPDLRETVPVGAGRMTGRSVGAHDVYTVGEFKDDQLQGHWHGDGTTATVEASSQANTKGFINVLDNEWSNKTTNFTKNTASDGAHGTARIGDTTHGKQLGVNYIIKAKQVAVPFDVAEYVKAYNSPDWDNAMNISSNLSTTDYTITDDGWIAGTHYATGGNIGVAIEVNGILVTSAGNATNYGWVGQCMTKVSKGDKVKFNKSGFTNVDVYFVPHK